MFTDLLMEDNLKTIHNRNIQLPGKELVAPTFFEKIFVEKSHHSNLKKKLNLKEIM